MKRISKIWFRVINRIIPGRRKGWAALSSAMVVVTTPVPNTDVFTEVSRLLAVAHLLGEAQARLGVTPEIVEMFDILATKTSWFLHAMSDGTLRIKKTPAKPANSFKN